MRRDHCTADRLHHLHPCPDRQPRLADHHRHAIAGAIGRLEHRDIVVAGGYTRQFRTQGPNSAAQGDAIKLVSKLAGSLGGKAREKVSAPSSETFKPPKVSGNPEKG